MTVVELITFKAEPEVIFYKYGAICGVRLLSMKVKQTVTDNPT